MKGELRLTRCAIYARVSDESQLSGDSLDHQISVCREMARRRGQELGEYWETPDEWIYVDEAVSGTSLVNRLQAQKLLADARAGCFQVVLFKGISRLARDTVDALLLLRTLLAVGVRVLSLEENFDSQKDNAEFIFTIHSALAQAESEKISIRVRMGAMQKAKSGRWNGQPPDGYLLNPQTQRLEIDKTFAPVIREIFSLYLQGYGTRKIAEILNKRLWKTKRNADWTARTISRILENPAYTGDVVYGRREKRLLAPGSHNWLKRRRITVWSKDKNSQAVCPSAHPPIISREIFSQVHTLMEQRRKYPGRSGQVHLLSNGLLRCSCGSRMIVKKNGRGKRYYRCRSQAEKGVFFCKQSYLPADEIEKMVQNAVLQQLKRLLSSHELPNVKQSCISVSKKRLAIQKQMDRVIKQSQELFMAYSQDGLSEEVFLPLNQKLKQQLQHLRNTEATLLAESKSEHQEGSAPLDAQQTLFHVVEELLHTPSPAPETTRAILQKMIQEIQVSQSTLSIQYRYFLVNHP